MQRAQHITKCICPTQKLVGKEQGMDLSLSAMAKKNKTKDRFRYCRKCSFSTTHLCLAPDKRQVNVGKHIEAQICFCFAFLQCCAYILIYSTSITEKGCAMGWRKIMELTEGARVADQYLSKRKQCAWLSHNQCNTHIATPNSSMIYLYYKYVVGA